MDRLMNNLYWLFLALFLGGILAIISACATVSQEPIESWVCHRDEEQSSVYRTVEKCEKVK